MVYVALQVLLCPSINGNVLGQIDLNQNVDFDLGDLFGQGVVHLNKLGIPFTIFAVVGVSNAFNMLDGKDGLAGSVSVATIACLLLLLYLNDIFFNWGLILIMSLLVFLAFNLNLFGSKRKIFLGDHGSNALGYSIAWTLIFLSQEENIITPISAIWFVFLPITDTLLTIIIRLKSSKSLFHGDRQHFHHKLSDLSLSDATILIILVVVSIFTGLFATGSNYWHWHEYNLTFGYFTVFVFLILLKLVFAPISRSGFTLKDPTLPCRNEFFRLIS